MWSNNYSCMLLLLFTWCTRKANLTPWIISSSSSGPPPTISNSADTLFMYFMANFTDASLICNNAKIKQHNYITLLPGLFLCVNISQSKQQSMVQNLRPHDLQRFAPHNSETLVIVQASRMSVNSGCLLLIILSCKKKTNRLDSFIDAHITMQKHKLLCPIIDLKSQKEN